MWPQRATSTAARVRSPANPLTTFGRETVLSFRKLCWKVLSALHSPQPLIPLPLAIYRAAPNFDVFDKDDFPCQGPTWQYDAGVALLVLYMVNMAILMLNLLIAVLSTVHDTVHERAELEFNLTRNQFIQRGAGVVARGHLPPPLNLLMVVVSAAIDMLLFAPTAVLKAPGTCMMILRACMKGVCTCLKIMRSCFNSSFKPETKATAAPRPLPADASGGGETPVDGGRGGTSSCAT